MRIIRAGEGNEKRWTPKKQKKFKNHSPATGLRGAKSGTTRVLSIYFGGRESPLQSPSSYPFLAKFSVAWTKEERTELMVQYKTVTSTSNGVLQMDSVFL